MYDKQILIPVKGDRTTVPDVAGKALQVTRLDFLDSEDPKGNPIFEADAGRLSARMAVADPIKTEFSGLVVRNPDSAEAAGTVAIVRIYEEGDVISRVPKRSQPIIRAKATYSTRTPYYQDNLSSNSTKSHKIISAGRSQADRLTGLMMQIRDSGSLSSGFPIRWALTDGSSTVFRSGTVTAAVGDNKYIQLVKNLLIPPSLALNIILEANDTGSGSVAYFVSGLILYDQDNHVPPQ